MIYSFDKVLGILQDLRTDRQEWEAEWRAISEYILPGRGVYTLFSQPRKRKLTSAKVINTVAEDSLYVLTSGLQAHLTSPSSAWFRLGWSDPMLDAMEPLKAYLQDVETLIYEHLQRSSFYRVMNSFYNEYAGFGNGCVYLGSDSGSDVTPLRFELLTAGEYYLTYDSAGRLDTFVRIFMKSQKQLVDMFDNRVPPSVADAVKRNESGIHKVNIPVIECVYKAKYQDKNYTQVLYTSGTVQGSGAVARNDVINMQPLKVAGYYEHPYSAARWSTIGSDTYGIGPGSRALSDIKRLQEMEKAFLMATHKSINPPLMIPARMRGKLNRLPGGDNYYNNPNELVHDLYQMQFDYQGVSAAVERVEQRIQRNFFNDLFLTASRDPNASPLKATQVIAQKQEMMFRLGPIIERLQSELLTPVIRRTYGILKRNDLLPLLPPDLENIVEDFTITLISPLATAQQAAKNKGVDNFLAFVGQVAQFDQSVLDNVDIDKAARHRADIEGVPLGILRPQDEVEELRKQRAEQMRQQAEAQQKLVQLEAADKEAGIRLKTAEAGQVQADAQQTVMDTTQGLQ